MNTSALPGYAIILRAALPAVLALSAALLVAGCKPAHPPGQGGFPPSVVAVAAGGAEGHTRHLRIHRADGGLPRGRGSRARDRHSAQAQLSAKDAMSSRANRSSPSIPHRSRPRSPARRPTSPWPRRNSRRRSGMSRACKPVLEAKAVSQKELDDAASAEQVASADVSSAQARVTRSEAQSRLHASRGAYFRLCEPRRVSEGSLVSGPNVLLTTVTQIDPMYVIFGIPDREYHRAAARRRSRTIEASGERPLQGELQAGRRQRSIARSGIGQLSPTCG